VGQKNNLIGHGEDKNPNPIFEKKISEQISEKVFPLNLKTHVNP
jgi:hypothetical protein